MKPFRFNVLRMIILMTQEYSFCEAFEKEGFSPDVSELQNAYDAGNGKINYKAECALKKVYKEHIVEGFEAEIIEYNAVTLPPEIEFSDVLTVGQILESNLPKGVAEILSGREDFVDTQDTNDKLYGTVAFENAIIECDAGAEKHSKEALAYLEALDKKMANNNISYIQIIK